MALYRDGDIELLANNWDNIMANVEQQRLALLEPTLDEMKEVQSIIINYLKKEKRKIYGGFALNLLVKEINPDYAIYKDNKVPDIDFYSFDPIGDLMKLCNILQEKGFKAISGREAMHQETYSLSVNYVTYCDISYVPRNIYNRMPFQVVEKADALLNGLILIQPHFMFIDYLRMMTDPLISYWRFDGDLKSYKRFYLLQKAYPFPKIKDQINLNTPDLNKQEALNEIFSYILKKTSIIVIGLYAYNYYLYESGLQDRDKSKQLINVPYYEFISSDYRNDFNDCVAQLKTNVIIQDKITHTEFYPYFQFTGHSVEIYCDSQLVCRIYNHNKKCLPYLDLPAIKFTPNKKTVEKHNKLKIRLGTYQLVLLYGLISIQKARTNNVENDRKMYYAMVGNLIEARNYYFNKEKKTFLDDTPFREFVVKCIGETIPPDRQRRLLIESRKKKNKRYSFNYDPADGIKEPITSYEFANSSGNAINNPKNLKLTDEIKEEDPEGDFNDPKAESDSDSK